MFDGKAFGQEVVAAVKAHIERSVAPLLMRVDAIDRRIAELSANAPDMDAVDRQIAAIEAKGADPAAIARVQDALNELRRGLPDAIAAAVKEIPAPKDGKDADLAEVRRMIDDAIAELPAPEPGKDADPEQVAALVAEAVQRAVGALPAPKDGKSVTAEELRPFIDEAVAKAAAAIPAPKDGVGLAGALVDRDGNLVVTLSNGETRSLGPVVGRDADMAAIERSIVEKFAAIPAPKDGLDGFGFDDMTEELADDGRTIIRRYVKGDRIKEFRHQMAVVLDRGIYKEGQTYQAGDGVTWAGSFWIAQEETRDKPDSGKGFRLAVKRGRDGKDGVLKPDVKPVVKVG